jgi:hypothetical protein
MEIIPLAVMDFNGKLRVLIWKDDQPSWIDVELPIDILTP